MELVKRLIVESLKIVRQYNLDYDNEDIRKVDALLGEAIDAIDGKTHTCGTCGSSTDENRVVCAACLLDTNN
jgi:hypothetical protein